MIKPPCVTHDHNRDHWVSCIAASRSHASLQNEFINPILPGFIKSNKKSALSQAAAQGGAGMVRTVMSNIFGEHKIFFIPNIFG